MRQQWYRLLIVPLLALLVTAGQALAANGKITGVVKTTGGEAVVGANVVVDGTTLGATADAEGRYYILNVPPGTYRVRASAVGYTPRVVENVAVGSDEIVTLDFALSEEAVGMAEIVVQAQRPVVDKSQTSSRTTLRSEEILELPVRSAAGLVATSASAFNGFIRGGRINETKTIVDGVDVSDQYYAAGGDQTVTSVFATYASVPRFRGAELSKVGDVNLSSVEQMNVNTGAVGAEYSSATAGVINYSLREGRGALKGSIFSRVSQLNGLSYNGPDIYWNDNIYMAEKGTLSRRVDSLKNLRALGRPASQYSSLANDSTRLGFYTYYPGKYVTEKPQYEVEGSLSGDIMENWGFFFSGKYFDSHGHLPGEFNRQVNLTLKTNYNFTPNLKVSAFGIVTDRGKIFGWKNRGYQESARFFLEGVPRTMGADVIGSLKFTHVLSPSTFYEIQGSMNSSSNQTGYSDDNGDGRSDFYEDGDFINLSYLGLANKYISNTDLSRFFRNQDEQASSTVYQFNAGSTTVRLARPGFFYENVTNDITTVKADLTHQLTFNHRLQAGGQLRLGKVDLNRQASYLGAVDTRKQFINEKTTRKPKEWGVYLQDRMEYAGLIINVGGRLDMWDPDAEDYADYFHPYTETMVPYDTLPGKTVMIKERVPLRGRKVDPYYFFSPRIGVSHPISDVAAMYFSFSRNSIPPPYSRLYAFYSNFGNISLPYLSSVRQEPYRSTNYELGAQWEFMPRFGLNFSAYMRDIENYGWYGYTIVPRSGFGTTYALNTSAGYADARGVELTLEAQRQPVTDWLTVVGQVSYAYTYIKASSFAGFDVNMKTLYSTANGDSAKYGGNIPLGDMQFFNRIETNVIGANSTLSGGYDRTHRITYQFILGFPYDITFSSIGTFQSGFFYPKTIVDDSRTAGRDLGVAPWNKVVNVRLEKAFELAGLRLALYADVENVFNWTNILAYDNSSTGVVQWEQSNQKGNPDPTGSARRPVGPDGSFFYGFPREFYFGARLDF